MASQEFLASFAVEIDEAGVSRLQQVLEENRDLADEVASAFEAATSAINEYQKAALGGDNPSGEGNRDDGSGKGAAIGSAEGSRNTGSPYNPEASARNRENGEYRSSGYKGEIQSLLSGSLTSSPDSSARDYSLRSAELYLAHALAPDEEYDRNTGSRVNPDSFYGDQQGAYYDTHDGLDSEISRYLYNQIGPRADSDYARELNTALRDLANAEASGDDTAEYLEQVKSLMPDLIQGVKDIVDKYDEPPEPSTSENGEGGGLEGSLNLEGARGELEAFREEAAEPVALSGNAAGIVSAAKSALSSIRSLFSTPLTIKAKVETEGGDGEGVNTGGSTLKMSTGGRFSKPTDVQVAEDGDAEYIIPVKKENRAVPLLKQLLTELSPEARQSLAGDDETAGAVPDEGLQALMPEREEKPEETEPLRQAAAQPLPQVREAEKLPPEAQTVLQIMEQETEKQPLSVTQVIQMPELIAPQPLPQVREATETPAAAQSVPQIREILAEPQPAPVQASEPEEKQEGSPAPAPAQETAPVPSVVQNFYEVAEPASQPLPVIREVIDTPAATQPLAAAAGKDPDPELGASGLLAKLGDLLSTSLHETVAPVVQNTSQNVSAPVTIQVRSTGANAEQVGQKLYDTAERYLLRTLKSAMA